MSRGLPVQVGHPLWSSDPDTRLGIRVQGWEAQGHWAAGRASSVPWHGSRLNRLPSLS